jgi:hypothetical protein
MKLFEGKSPAERNKIIAAIVLGVASVTSLYLAFGSSFFGGSKTTVTVSASPTPRPVSTRELREVQMPSQQEQYFDWQTTPINYVPGRLVAPDAGRNIFAFYEPPVPCRGAECPTPIPPTPPPAVPEATPPVFVAYATPAQIFAGSKGFRLEITGDKFTPDMAIYFSQSQLPTTFINAQRLVADVPASMIASEGPRQIIIQSADGKSYSNQSIFNVQPPPKPQVQFVGLITRQFANNDTAVFREQGKPEFTARLNDLVGGRFRLVSIASDKVIFEDVNLGFRHPVQLFTQAPGADVSTAPVPGGGRRPPFQPQGIPQDFQQPDPGATQGIPGIPDNIPRYIPPNSNTNRPQRQQGEQKDDDGEDKP